MMSSDKEQVMNDYIKRLEQENIKLRIALCNLRDEYLDLGGDPNQLELFDTDNPSQLNLDFEIEKTSNGDFEVKKIFESPDGGKTVFQRPIADFNPENKIEIDWKTKEPTGRVFSDYNNGHWDNLKDEG